MAGWRGKSKAGPLGYRIFVAILKMGGVAPGYFLLRFVAFYYLLFSFTSTKYTFLYFHKRLGYGKLKSIFKTYRNYNMLGQSLIDKIVIMGGMPNKFTFNLDGVENLHQMANLGKGGLLLTAHIGNWEIASHLLNSIDSCINIVTFDGENPLIKAYLDSVTGDKGRIKFIYIKGDMSHLFKINDAFFDNEFVCMPADRFMEGNKTITVKFLGEDAKFPLGPFLMAAKFGVPVSFVYGMKETKTHYHFYGSKIKEYSHLESEEGVSEIVKDFIADMEDKVRKYPEQWFNYYQFWEK